MNSDYGAKVFVAAAEQGLNAYKMKEYGYKYVLVSYPSLGERPVARLTKILSILPENVEVLLDSGGYHLQNKEDVIYGLEAEEYIQNYIDLVRYAKGTDKIVGMFAVDPPGDTLRIIRKSLDRMEEYRDELPQIIPVYHLGFGKEVLHELTVGRDYDYIGIGGVASSDGFNRDDGLSEEDILGRVIRDCHESGIKTHLLGVTPPTHLARYRHMLYSCDSRSWNAGAQFGSLTFTDRQRDDFFLTSDRQKLEQEFKRKLDWTYREYDDFNLKNWKRIQKYAIGGKL